MTDAATVTRAYLYLIAYEKLGATVLTFNIDKAWIAYCRGEQEAGMELVGCAAQEGFQL